MEVTNVKTGESITCKVDDRIGKVGRIDLTKNAFKQLAPLSVGLLKVQVKPVDTDGKQENTADVMFAKDALAKQKLAQDEQRINKNNQDGTVHLAFDQDR